MHKTVDVDKHVKNISSYKFSFFEKLVLCRGLNFAFPRDVLPLEIKVSFEKAYWMLEPKLSDDQKELAAKLAAKQTPAPPRKSTPDPQSVRIVLPFKEQKSADSVRKQLKDLSKLLNIDLCPVFISRKVGEDLKHKEIKPALINEQSIVYKFECGCCDACWLHASTSLPTDR